MQRKQGAPRLRQPNRLQVALRASDLESLLPEDHLARLVWGDVGGHKARGRHVDRAAIDPRHIGTEAVK